MCTEAELSSKTLEWAYAMAIYQFKIVHYYSSCNKSK